MNMLHFTFFVNNDSRWHIGESWAYLNRIYPVQYIRARSIVLHTSRKRAAACGWIGNCRKQQTAHVAGKSLQNAAITGGHFEGNYMATYVGCEDGVIQSRSAVI